MLVDLGYGSNTFGEEVDYGTDRRPTGRRLVGPQHARHNRYSGRKKQWRETRRRGLLRAHRQRQRQLDETRTEYSLYFSLPSPIIYLPSARHVRNTDVSRHVLGEAGRPGGVGL